MNKVLNKFGKVISNTLLVIGMIFISFQTIELVWETIKNFIGRFQEVGLNYVPEYSRVTLVLFFNVLLALEILETIKVFNHSHTVKVRIIMLICLIAVARKIFIMDVEHAEPLEDFGVAALILALSVGYFLVSRQLASKISSQPDDDETIE